MDISNGMFPGVPIYAISTFMSYFEFLGIHIKK